MFKQAVKTIIDIPARLADTPLPKETEDERQLAANFRNKMANLKIGSDVKLTDQWRQNLIAFQKAVLDKDPREFMRWEETLPLRAGPGVFPQYFNLRRSKLWSTRWKPNLTKTHIGHPKPFFLRPDFDCNSVLLGHHIAVMERFTKREAEDVQVVFEFGGGFGGMARIFHRLGFNGIYFIFDFYHQNLLQEYYLKATGHNVYLNGDITAAKPGVYLYNDLDKAVEALSSTGRHPAWFIANWSLSESPVELRKEIEAKVFPHMDGLLVSYQESFSAIDNVKYFADVERRLSADMTFATSSFPLRRPRDFYFLAQRRR